jgi:hypothetical protein
MSKNEYLEKLKSLELEIDNNKSKKELICRKIK